MNIIEISIKDELTPFVRAAIEARPTLRPRILRSIAWFTQKRIKELSNDSRVTGRYEDRKPYDIVRKPLARGGKPPRNIWWGKLRQAIGYQYDGQQALLGWTSRASAMEGGAQEEGKDRLITPNIRAYYAKIRDTVSPELKVPGKKPAIELPARPLYEPAMKIIHPEYKGFLQQKVTEYMAGIVHNGVRKSNRKYRVY